MAGDNNVRSISDAREPNAGRVYDYLLGGNYNFKVDREAGDHLIKILPIMREIATLIRWFLGIGVKKGIELGFTQFLDFASGLPTVNHIHTLIPEGMKNNVKIIYSDIDPITVQLGKDIIGDNPLMRYELCDIRTPKKLLESDIIKDFFGDNHKVAIGANGIFYFLTDDEVNHTLRSLHDWAAKDSILFFCDGDYRGQSNDGKKIADIYEKMNQPVYLRSKERMEELIKPWNIMEPGFVNLEEWHKRPSQIMDDTLNAVGGNYYGAFLIK